MYKLRIRIVNIDIDDDGNELQGQLDKYIMGRHTSSLLYFPVSISIITLTNKLL